MLRCPHCGARHILQSWFRLKERCPRCKLHLHREEYDYFLGSYTVMLLAIEGVFAFVFVGTVVLTWPNTPWELLQWGGSAVMIVAALFIYPFAKTVWLAIDLMFRPVGATELGWYQREELQGDDKPPH
ncbi:MAG: DUF983 domain-containing protein [Gemmatimonadaceae bacterium]